MQFLLCVALQLQPVLGVNLVEVASQLLLVKDYYSEILVDFRSRLTNVEVIFPTPGMHLTSVVQPLNLANSAKLDARVSIKMQVLS